MSLVSLINALSNILGPLAGGVCFLFIGIMEIFISMEFKHKKTNSSVTNIIKNDIKESSHYITKENPVMLKAMFIVA
jgi:hypothetical protein